MTVLLVAAAIVAGIGAIAALAPLDPRLGLIGLTAALVGAALLADPLPATAVLAVRLAGALLAVVLLHTAAASGARRDEPAGGPGWSAHAGTSGIGWPAEALLAAAGATAGIAIAAAVGPVAPGGDLGQPAAAGPADLLGAGSLALGLAGLIVAIAIAPVLADRLGGRRSVAAVLLVQAAVLARGALVGESSTLGEVVFAALLVIVAAVGAVLVGASPAAEPLRAASPGAGERAPARRP